MGLSLITAQVWGACHSGAESSQHLLRQAEFLSAA